MTFLKLTKINDIASEKKDGVTFVEAGNIAGLSSRPPLTETSELYLKSGQTLIVRERYDEILWLIHHVPPAHVSIISAGQVSPHPIAELSKDGVL